MWDNSVERRFIRNIIIAILCAASLGALFFVMKKANAAQAEEVASLVEVSSQKQAEQEEKISETYRSLEEEYRKDMEVLAQYVPGIVCWGDTLTRGTSGNISYPGVLQDCINTNLCERYDFTASLNGNVVFSGVDAKRYTMSIPVINMGGGNENSATILTRAGVDHFVLHKSIVIPSEAKPVRIYLESASGYTANPLTVGDQGLNPVTIDGIEGVINYVSDDRGSYYTFTRSQAGEEYSAPRGAEIICSNVDDYSDYIHVIWLGAYDTTFNTARYIEWCESLLSRQTKNTDRYVIIGPCSYYNSWYGTYVVHTLNTIDDAMMARFGDHYISLRKYLATDGLRDAGITASKDDKSSMTAGAVPESFRSGNGSVEFSALAYELIGDLVYDRLLRLGYFDEIIDELNIDMVTKSK